MLNNSPLRILLLLVYVGLMVGAVLIVSPGEIPLGGELSLRIPTTKDVLPKEWLEEENFQKAQETQLASQEDLEVDSVAAEASAKTTEVKKPVKKKLKVSWKPGSIALEYPANNKEALANFFNALQKVEEKGSHIRVMHFGDSQLEGDRMTERLRRRFQNQFGGHGIGYIPMIERRNIRTSVAQEYSRNWKRKSVLKKDSTDHNFYGMNGAYYYFNESDKDENASASFVSTGYTTKREKQIDRFRLFYKNPEEPLYIYYTLNEGEENILRVPPSTDLQATTLPINGGFDRVDLFLESKGQPEFYGISMDGTSGISVDNMAIRGSSGVEFTKLNKAFFKEQMDELDTKLIIFQFGVNVVPQERESYAFYERLLTHQLQYLKSIAPDCDIVVVGVSDMAKKIGTEIQTYPSIDLVRAAQRKAAKRAGCVYWDLYLAMGGENSIRDWAEMEPALANKDFIHFTRTGANKVGDLLFDELMREYKKFKEQK
ncbi:GDSL-type esterase/lipase family protein [Sediminitomix flava]|uniref:GDSL-like lipase/acylhydrolase family protein n=1 Tax=Sediminitomix flava TaxID=379075 RepID=A0A316A0G3_SEDFL|nr:GDSL-type esterase/lipase family protein [Sediminitomix flava]PWJ43137.1 GDSL-like lipase/acylhydrolase family protein [Sediminitomix flava]